MNHSGIGECEKRDSCLRYAMYLKYPRRFNAYRTCSTSDYPHYIETKVEVNVSNE